MAVQAYQYGLTEVLKSLVKKSPVIMLGTGVASGIGFLVAGTPAAIIAAKITCCSLSLFYGIGHPEAVSGITSEVTMFRAMGNLTPIILMPFFLFYK
ncbi:MAG: hypothetical protein K1000chlam3_01460 [Chlamydiae bacterium]|nr:hypothetical protein [Chlamydiota bacterium]